MQRIGLIADTHNRLRDEALRFLDGCDHILHAGDVGDESILERLAELAPLTTVRGNNDRADWAERLPHTARCRFEEVELLMIHDLKELEQPPAEVQVVVAGHSHKPVLRREGDLLYVNPGSAGPRRFTLPIAIGELEVAGDTVTARVYELVEQDGGYTWRLLMEQS